jgi:hypothetical protein
MGLGHRVTTLGLLTTLGLPVTTDGIKTLWEDGAKVVTGTAPCLRVTVGRRTLWEDGCGVTGLEKVG